ncbi:hypothetical protein [Cryptosporangium sp. NPDC051539]|uniref:hypothetical protein n=1 Tax=Cryptosporangium sp. NPDC051539 TaxID=3363962 RepID=UPI0037943A95
MLGLRQVAAEPRLFAVSVGGSAVVVLLVAWLAGFAVALALAVGLLVLGMLFVVRLMMEAEQRAADAVGAVGGGHERTAADLRALGGRVAAVESGRRDLDELSDRVARLETVVSVLTRWPRTTPAESTTTSVFFRPSAESTGRRPGRDQQDWVRRRAVQERGRQRAARWRTQLKSGPDRLAVFVDVFWLPAPGTGDGRPMLFVRRTRMEAPEWPPPEEARPVPEAYVLAMEERFADSRSGREIGFWSAPVGEDLGRLVARLAADRDRWQDVADGLPSVVRDGDSDRLGPAATTEIETLLASAEAGAEPVRIVRYTGLMEGVTTADGVLRHASVVWTEGDPVATLVADAFTRSLELMTAEPGRTPNVGPGSPAAAGIARWHGVDGLRVDARSVLDQRAARRAERQAVRPRAARHHARG